VVGLGKIGQLEINREGFGYSIRVLDGKLINHPARFVHPRAV